MENFLIIELIKLFCFWLLAFTLGNLVRKYNIKVNYTRKVHHFSLLFFPVLLAAYFPYEDDLLGLIGAFSFIWTIVPFYFRNHIPTLETCFLSFDRPEDRPFTLLWLITQFFFGLLIGISVAIFAEIYFGIPWPKIALLVLCLAHIGDGLAEPIGVRFGRIKYKTYALFTKKRYYRTLEGSLAVLISTIVVLIWFNHLFTAQQFIWALLTLPFILMITEAVSPHTWDGPFLSGVSGLAIGLILTYG